MRKLPLADRIISTNLDAFVMGIINTTPDSFWENSRKLDAQQASDFALKMIDEGVDILDIGGESTRPGSSYVDEAEEIKRLIPVIKAIRKKTNCPISVDTRKKNVFERALDEGADIVNDISALEDDENLASFCAKKKNPIILMHKRGIPSTMQSNTNYSNVLEDILTYLEGRKKYALSFGITEDKIIVDPGIGFGKDFGANSILIKSAHIFEKRLNCPVLIGLSRKSVIGQCDCNNDRLAGTIAANMLAVQNGAKIIRVHDVQENVAMLKVIKKMGEVT